MKVTFRRNGKPIELDAAGVPWTSRHGYIYTYISGAKNYLKRGVHSGGTCFVMVTPEVVKLTLGRETNVLDEGTFPLTITLDDDCDDEEQVKARKLFTRWRAEVLAA